LNSDDDVAQYLKSNPRFFDEHPELLETIAVPHPHDGRAIPLAERQLLTLRDKARVLEAKLGELIQFGEDNDAISEKVHRLAVALAGAKYFANVAHALYFHLREDFSVPHVALRLWGYAMLEGTQEGGALSEAQRGVIDTMGTPVYGPVAGEAQYAQLMPLFGEAAEHVRSMAAIPLGSTRTFGVLLLGSEDAQRFYPEMGSLFLRRIGELSAAALSARL
jgi:uncharacterized protein YigA (DUF484 family)